MERILNAFIIRLFAYNRFHPLSLLTQATDQTTSFGRIIDYFLH